MDDDKTNSATSNQGKPKGKWSSKNKKSKKRLESALRNTPQKESDGQEIPQPVLEASDQRPKEELQTEHDMLTPDAATSESLPPSMHLPETIQDCLEEPFRDAKGQAMTSTRTPYHYNTLPRGRPDFRNSAGGSLKIPKKRKNKYPTITSKTFEASEAGNFEPPQPGCADDYLVPTTNTDEASGVGSPTHARAPDLSKKSRLNPLATAFESPCKGTAAAAVTEALSNSPGVASFRAGLGGESLGKNRPPSKFKVMQRPATAHNSPTKASQPKDRLIRRLDGPRTAGSLEVSTRQQENNPNEMQRDWSKDKPRQQRESKALADLKATLNRKDCGKAETGLDAEDWPSLPGSRARSATLQ
ncbi:hypothetical protein Trco_007625 [Trichoderma cornu-damae]|uniref:Uncharacterized protein n=1 Tax=Trichoderma cornu-damae TaxID=654480 RepID=A0A9P8TUH9_9HYPO|nr:hypothetical protein Trco_007625 [Trichoderma cornu-damae]